MPLAHSYSQKFNTITVLVTGKCDFENIMKYHQFAFVEKNYPQDVNQIWHFLDCQLHLEVSEIHEIARLNQSIRELDGYPATALVTLDPKIKILLEEFLILAHEVPVERRIFENYNDALLWIISRVK